MFEFVRTHNRLFQFLLLLVILPSFVLVGVQSYTSLLDGANASVATVDGAKITQAQLEASERQQVERIRQQNPTIDPKLLDTPEMKKRVLDQLVREKVLQAASDKELLNASMERVKDVIKTDPNFAPIYNPDGTVNDAVLAAQGLTRAGLAVRVQQMLSQQQPIVGVVSSSFASPALATVTFDAMLQQREVRLQRFEAKDFAAKLNPSDAEIEAFYKDAANAKQFEQPETAQIQYVVLDVASLKAGVTVSADEMRKYYEENSSRYTVAEERRASHILIKAAKDAPAAEKAKAKAKTEELLAQVRKNPGSFAEVAKKNSQDEGSSSNGGDVGWIGRGSGMVKPFEDAVFALKSGEIGNVVETEFGYHIIELTGVRGGTKKSFDEVKGEIEEEVRKQLAQKRFTEMAEGFTNMVYEQPDSLQPVADKFKLALQTATVTRKPALTASGPMASAKLMDVVFASDSLRNKRNTEAVETAPSQLVSARIVKYSPAQAQPLAEIKDRVRGLLIAKLAKAQTIKAGQERLAALQKSADAEGLSEAVVVSRAKPAQLPPKVLDGILSADASKLPTFAGVDVGDGSYVVARIDKLLPRDPAVIDAKRMTATYAQSWASAENDAYYNALKARYKVVIKAPAAAASTAAQ